MAMAAPVSTCQSKIPDFFKKVLPRGSKICISGFPCRIFVGAIAHDAAENQAGANEKHGFSYTSIQNPLPYIISDVHKNIARCLFSYWKGFGLPGTHKTTLLCWVNAPKSHLPWIDLPSATKTPCVTFNPVLLWQKISTKEGVQRSPTVATTA